MWYKIHDTQTIEEHACVLFVWLVERWYSYYLCHAVCVGFKCVMQNFNYNNGHAFKMSKKKESSSQINQRMMQQNQKDQRKKKEKSMKYQETTSRTTSVSFHLMLEKTFLVPKTVLWIHEGSEFGIRGNSSSWNNCRPWKKQLEGMVRMHFQIFSKRKRTDDGDDDGKEEEVEESDD